MSRLVVGISYATLAVLLMSIFYGYLTTLYLVDEVYDGNGPRELELAEKFTVRVLIEGGDGGPALSRFVSTYSLCQSVEEVQVIWLDKAEGSAPPPSPSDFVYAHTHSRVSFHTVAATAAAQPLSATVLSQAGLATVATETVLLLDVGVEAECADLAFAHNVWRSGKGTLVGFFPRLHRHYPDTKQYTYYGWLHVWWNGIYSILLPKGLFVSKVLLQKLGASNELSAALQLRPECVDMALSAFAAADNGRPPVWANVPVRLGREKSRESTAELAVGAECLAALAAALKVERLPYSRHKSSRASSFVFWSL